jgi:UPF0716 family protein affecting phage T7 exclusion
LKYFGFLYPLSEFTAWYFFIDKFSFLDAILLCFTTGAVGLFITSLHMKALLQDLALVNLSRPDQDPKKILAGKAINRMAIIFGGLCLFIPGLVAKAFGTLLIIPGLRHLLVLFVKSKFSEKLVANGFQFVMRTGGVGGAFGFGKGFGQGMSENPEETPREVFEVKPQSIEHKDKD